MPPRSPRGAVPRGVTAVLPAVLLAQWPPRAATAGIVGLAELPKAPIVVEFGDQDECKWPVCHKRRLPCATKKVGTCVMPQPGCYNKHAVCSLGRCNCPDDYCAVPGTRRCEPQVVYEGARPAAFEQKFWLRLFAALGRPDQFPDLGQVTERPESLISPRCLPAVALLLLGLTVAFVTAMGLCNGLLRCICCKRHARAVKRGGSESDSPDEDVGDGLTLFRLDWLNDKRADRPKHGKEPRASPVVLLAGLVVVLNAWAVYSRYTNWGATRQILDSQLRHLKNDSLALSQQTLLLNYTASNLSFAFVQISQCTHNPLMSMVGGLAVNSTEELAEIVHKFQAGVRDVPFQVDRAQETLVRYSGRAVWLPCAPMLIMSAFALVMLSEVFIARFFGTPATARCENKGLALCGIGFVLIIVFVAVTCAAILSVVIGSAQICTNIDQNVVDFVSSEVDAAVAGPIFVNVSRFYIFGDTYNPLNGFVDDINEYIQTVVELWHDYRESIVKPQSLSCGPLGELDDDIEGIQAVINDNLKIAKGLLSTQNMYRYYRETVHEGICNQMPKSLGQYCIQQAVVGLILFPLCAICTHQYLAHHVSKQKLRLEEFEFWLSDTTEDGDTEVATEVTDSSDRSPNLESGTEGGAQVRMGIPSAKPL